MNIVSTVTALAILYLAFELTSSAPLSQVEDQSVRGKATEVAANDKLLNALQLLLERRAMRMAFNQVLAAEQGKSANWVYPPLISKVKSEGSEEREPDDESPMKKAAHKHFKISEPGTGPILNHPLDITDTGLDRDTIDTLINELLSTDKWLCIAEL